ncbi:MAG TPA: hypothetical protein VGR85_03835 [Candidatus Limnocylindria bacterium]|jgi:hypothetical protein|nr:hypothetical protein [Candidatus Limnocylindria bacterium]
MRRILLAFAISLLTLGSLAAPAAAKCPTCVDGVSVQTPDGQPWSEGKPVTLVVSARRGDPEAAFPSSGLAVIMQTDRERTKCLDVPLKLVSQSGDGALYAGVFYPFRSAIYSGIVQFGDFSFDITIDVNKVAATTPVATNDLPVAAPEQAVGETLSYTIGMVPFVLLALAFWSAVALLIARRQPRMRTV